MKIVEVITLGSEYYGAQKHVLDLSNSLKDGGHEVTVLVGNEGKLTEKLKSSGITFIVVRNLVREINIYHDIKCVLALIKLFKELRPDIVALHSSKAGLLGRIACWFSNVPCVFTAHGWSFAEGVKQPSRTLYLYLEKAASKISNKIITVSNLEKVFAISKGIPENKLEMIYYGINDKYKSDIQVVESEKVRIVMVAGFREQKDHLTLIKALEKIQELPWEVYFLGDGHLEEKYKNLVANLGMSNRFYFEGAVNNVENYLFNADLLVLTTHWEGLPISIIEGMSFYLPILATDVAGVKEAVIDNRNGIVVNRQDINEVSQGLKRLINSKELRHQFGQNSRKLFETNFTIDMMYNQTLSLYRKVVEQRNTKGS